MLVDLAACRTAANLTLLASFFHLVACLCCAVFPTLLTTCCLRQPQSTSTSGCCQVGILQCMSVPCRTSLTTRCRNVVCYSSIRQQHNICCAAASGKVCLLLEDFPAQFSCKLLQQLQSIIENPLLFLLCLLLLLALWLLCCCSR